MSKKITLIGALALLLIIGATTLTLGGAPGSHADDHDEAGHEEHAEGAAGADDHEQPGQIHLSAAQIQAGGIELSTAAPRALQTAVQFPGEIRFNDTRTAHVVPRVSGFVEQVLVEPGQPVSKGQVLAVIASQPLSDLRSELDVAQRRTELARLTYQREQTLWQEQITAEQDVLLARQALREAEIAQANTRRKLSAIGAAPSPALGNRYELRAPFDASVVEMHLTVGEMVSDASNAFTLSDLSQVWATFAVPAREIGTVSVGQTVQVNAADLGASTTGRITYVGNLLGEQTRSATVRVSLANPQGAWRPGLPVNVAVAAASRQAAVTVPQKAVQAVDEKPAVFMRTAEGFQLQPVVLGSSSDGYVEVLEGLAAGVQVASAGSFILKSELGKGSAEHSH